MSACRSGGQDFLKKQQRLGEIPLPVWPFMASSAFLEDVCNPFRKERFVQRAIGGEQRIGNSTIKTQGRQRSAIAPKPVHRVCVFLDCALMDHRRFRREVQHLSRMRDRGMGGNSGDLFRIFCAESQCAVATHRESCQKQRRRGVYARRNFHRCCGHIAHDPDLIIRRIVPEISAAVSP